MNVEDHRVKGSPCRVCGSILDGAFLVEDEHVRPEPGNVSVCIYCTAVSVYDEDMSLREPNEVEQEILDQDVDLLRIRAGILLASLAKKEQQ